MSIGDIPVFAVLRDTMSMLGARQKLLARNIANADTPGYVPKDIDQKSFQSALAQVTGKSGASAARHIKLATTEPGHIRRHDKGGSRWKAVSRPDTETTLNGNAVMLEEQVSRVAETRMRYDAAASLYQKSLGLVRLALKSPGR